MKGKGREVEKRKGKENEMQGEEKDVKEIERRGIKKNS